MVEKGKGIKDVYDKAKAMDFRGAIDAGAKEFSSPLIPGFDSLKERADKMTEPEIKKEINKKIEKEKQKVLKKLEPLKLKIEKKLEAIEKKIKDLIDRVTQKITQKIAAAVTKKATLAANTLAEQARQFDFSEAQALDIHMDNIAEMQRQFDLTDNQVRDLAADALSENIRQFDLTSAQDMEMFGQNLQETARQFNMSHAQTARLAAETLTQQKDIAEQGLKVQHVANMLNFMIEGAEALTVQDGINILDMAFEMSDIEKELGITPEQTASVSRVISEVSNEGTDGQRLHAALNDPSIWAGGADHDQDILDQLDFNFDGVIDNSDYILYRAGGGQFEFETELG